MAKIQSLELLSIPEEIHVGDSLVDITVVTKIDFHPIDVQLQMPYLLHVFIYDVKGDLDAPIIISNWDETHMYPVDKDARIDDFLGSEVIAMTADESEKRIITPMALSLGVINKVSSTNNRKLRVFGTLAPAVGRASKWSEIFESKLLY